MTSCRAGSRSASRANSLHQCNAAIQLHTDTVQGGKPELGGSFPFHDMMVLPLRFLNMLRMDVLIILPHVIIGRLNITVHPVQHRYQHVVGRGPRDTRAAQCWWVACDRVLLYIVMGFGFWIRCFCSKAIDLLSKLCVARKQGEDGLSHI